MLSPKGRAAVLYMTGPEGWGGIRSDVGQAGLGAGEGDSTRRVARPRGVAPGAGEAKDISKTLVVIDIPPYIESIRKAIGSIDIKPRQVLIEARLVEVNRDDLRDIGFDFTTGEFGTFQLNPVDSGFAGGTSFSSYASPASFNPVSADIESTPGADGLFNTGMTLLYQKMGGFEFEAMLHALEETVSANVHHHHLVTQPLLQSWITIKI